MQLHYSVHRNDTKCYTKNNVKCITFVDGKLVVVLEDNNGEAYTLAYTKESLEDGVIAIM